MLEVSSLNVTIPRGEAILADVSFSLNKGQILTVFGPSGCGKSTLLNAIAGFLEVVPPTREGGKARHFLRQKWFPGADGLAASGRIAMHGADVTHELTKDRPIGLVLQRFGVYPHMTAYANIAFPLRCRRLADDLIRPRVAKAAAMAGINPSHLPRKVKTLSGGEAQRVAIAKMLAKGANLALMDEPFSHLDQIRRSELIELIRHLVDANEEGMDCAIIISHDWRELRYADQAILLNARGDGRRIARLFRCRPANGLIELEGKDDALPPDAQELKWLEGLRAAIALGSAPLAKVE